MSDWRSRAKPVPAEAAAGGWRSRARPVDAPAPQAATEEPGKMESAARGISQGVSFGLGDEFAGLSGAWGHLIGSGLRDVVTGEAFQLPESFDAYADKVKGRFDGTLNAYRKARDATHAVNDTARAANPRTFFAGELAGGIATAPVTGGTRFVAGAPSLAARVGRAALMGAGTGAVAGAGNSSADLTRGEFGEYLGDVAWGTGLGGVFGAGGQALGEGVGLAVDRLRQAGPGLRERAREIAEARAAKRAAEETNSARGRYGAAAQDASRATENILRVRDAASAQRTGPQEAERLRRAAQTAAAKAEEMRLGIRALGREGAVERSGEFLSTGSRLDSAQSLARQADIMEESSHALVRQADNLLATRAADEVLDDSTEALAAEAARRAAILSPDFSEVQRQVLLSSVDKLERAAPLVQATRAAFQEAREGQGGRAAQYTQDMLSGRSAAARGRELALRYGLPLLGSAIGGEVGGAATAGLGYLMGAGTNHAIGALAGAGMRPALQSAYRTVTQHPAAMNSVGRALSALPEMGGAAAVAGVLGSGVERARDAQSEAQERVYLRQLPRLVESSPAAFGRYGPVLQQQMQEGGLEAVLALDAALADRDEEYRKARDTLMGSLQATGVQP